MDVQGCWGQGLWDAKSRGQGKPLVCHGSKDLAKFFLLLSLHSSLCSFPANILALKAAFTSLLTNTLYQLFTLHKCHMAYHRETRMHKQVHRLLSVQGHCNRCTVTSDLQTGKGATGLVMMRSCYLHSDLKTKEPEISFNLCKY